MGMEYGLAEKILGSYSEFPAGEEQRRIVEMGLPRGRINGGGRKGGLTIEQCSPRQIYSIAMRLYRKAEKICKERITAEEKKVYEDWVDKEWRKIEEEQRRDLAKIIQDTEIQEECQ